MKKPRFESRSLRADRKIGVIYFWRQIFFSGFQENCYLELRFWLSFHAVTEFCETSWSMSWIGPFHYNFLSICNHCCEIISELYQALCILNFFWREDAINCDNLYREAKNQFEGYNFKNWCRVRMEKELSPEKYDGMFIRLN